MYDTTRNIEKHDFKQEGFVIVTLSAKEYQKLKTVTIGYGKLRAFARKVELHENTIRDILNKGTGKPETISKVRAGLAA